MTRLEARTMHITYLDGTKEHIAHVSYFNVADGMIGIDVKDDPDSNEVTSIVVINMSVVKKVVIIDTDPDDEDETTL